MIQGMIDDAPLTGHDDAPLTGEGIEQNKGPAILIVKVIKILAIIGCCGLVSIGCFGFWFGWHTYNKNNEIDPQLMLLSVYMVLFGCATLLAELDYYGIFRKFPFLQSRFGRGMTYIFIGSLVFVQGVRFEENYYEYFTEISGGYEMGIGSLLVCSYCFMRSGKAGKYNVLDSNA